MYGFPISKSRTNWGIYPVPGPILSCVCVSCLNGRPALFVSFPTSLPYRVHANVQYLDFPDPALPVNKRLPLRLLCRIVKLPGKRFWTGPW